jgi:hypothetical protein
MKHRTFLAMLAAILCTALLAPAGFAQDRDDDRDDDDNDGRRTAIGIGAGVVEPDGTGEIYFHGAVRIRLFDGEDDDDGRDDDDWRYAGRGDTQAHIEPEIGYWERDENGASESDLSIGVNALGLIPGRVVDYYFGVGLGYHFLDTRVDGLGTQPDLDESNGSIGGNFHVGLDVHLGENVSLFGTGRLDVVEGREDTLQSKVFMGLRFGI